MSAFEPAGRRRSERAAGEVVTSMPPGRNPHSTVAWTVVIPVKGAPAAKSRLGPAVPDDARAVLARAFALDTIAAALAAASVARVIVVGDDPSLAGAGRVRARAAVARRGCRSAPDAGATRGLISAIGRASTRPAPRRRSPSPCCSATCPRCAPRSSTRRSRRPRGIRSPSCATPTARARTLATAAAEVPFEPRFGPDSAARHVAAGFAELAASDLPGLTRDVDTVDGLETVLHHGVGDHTAEAVARLADRKGSS